jgi:hypothetical protein
METIGKLVIFVLLIIGVVLYASFAWGYVASVIYEWVVLPTFPSLPILKWWQFSGMMFLVNTFVHSDLHHFKEEVKDKTTGSIIGILSPWLTLFAAWIFKIIIF